MIAAQAMRKMNLITYRNDRVRGRDDRAIWWRTKVFRWHRVDLNVDDIIRAGGELYDATHYANYDIVFQAGDEGVARIKAWCKDNCAKGWHYEPATTFLFKNISDATLFKMMWA